jgi:hypothetical protein
MHALSKERIIKRVLHAVQAREVGRFVVCGQPEWARSRWRLEYLQDLHNY